MTGYEAPEKVRLVWFSGTGGTKMAAEKLAASLRARGVAVMSREITVSAPPDEGGREDMLVLLYPVYALGAPGPVYDSIKKLGQAGSTPAAVLSVSGGGETTPNKACRRRVIRLLTRKGYRVVYERMLIMPSNVLTATPFGAAVCILRALPGKINKITDDIMSGVTRRTKPGPLNTALSVFGRLEVTGAKMFGRHIKASADCTGCGSCAAGCPTGNIRLEDGRPVFSNKCATCMKCLYGCPQKALSPKYGRFAVIREGYSLAEVEKAAFDENVHDSAAGAKGFLWGGISAYLAEKD